MAKQQREVAVCEKCGLEFTRVREVQPPGHAPFYADSDCMRCRAAADQAIRNRAALRARERWAKAIAANDRALDQCLSGKLRFLDCRTGRKDGAK
jgi:hypothetical protein